MDEVLEGLVTDQARWPTKQEEKEALGHQRSLILGFSEIWIMCHLKLEKWQQRGQSAFTVNSPKCFQEASTVFLLDTYHWIMN